MIMNVTYREAGMPVVFQPENPLMQVVELTTRWAAFFDIASFDIGI
jgi:hypothetical protein